MVSVATEETMGSARGREGEGSLLGHFEVEVSVFQSLEGLFFEAPPLGVLTMIVGLNKA